MKTGHLFASAAIAAVLVMTAPAQAQALRGALRGGAASGFAGSFGTSGRDATATGRMSLGSDAALHGNIPQRRAADSGARDAAKVGARASSATLAGVREGRDEGAGITQASTSSVAAEAHELPRLDTAAKDANSTTAPVVGASGHAMTSERANSHQASGPGSSAHRGDSVPARSSSSGVRSTSGAQSDENPRPAAVHADASTSASAEASASVSRPQ